jgi:hypothetical protein
MVKKLSALVAPAAAILLIASLAGCAPASGPTSSGATTNPAAPSAAPSSAPKGTTAALTALPANCPSPALVSSDLGISASLVDNSGDSTSLNCTYGGSVLGDSVSINFSTVRQLSPAEAEAQTKAQGFTSAFAKVPGVGDFALYDQAPSGGSYIVVGSGPVAFHIVAAGTESKQQLTTLAIAII